VLGRYVRDEQVITLPKAIRKLSKLPASNLKLWDRGGPAEGYFADIVMFGPSLVSDHASFSRSHQFSTSMACIIVNREAAAKGGHIGALLVQIVRGPTWRELQQAREPDTPQ